MLRDLESHARCRVHDLPEDSDQALHAAIAAHRAEDAAGLPDGSSDPAQRNPFSISRDSASPAESKALTRHAAKAGPCARSL